MRIWGAVVLLGYAAMAVYGWEPFAREQRGAVASAGRAGGTYVWFGGGYRGGK